MEEVVRSQAHLDRGIAQACDAACDREPARLTDCLEVWTHDQRRESRVLACAGVAVLVPADHASPHLDVCAR